MIMTRIVAQSMLVSSLLGSLGLAQAQEKLPELLQVYSVSPENLALAKARLQAGDESLHAAMNRLREEANAAIATGPFSVIDKPRTPPSGDKHDYLSQAPYVTFPLLPQADGTLACATLVAGLGDWYVDERQRRRKQKEQENIVDLLFG